MQIHISRSVKLTSVLSFIFFFSGFAALMYQVAWQRLLTVHYGVGAISITLIVSVYMFGLGLGALCGGFWAERSKNKILFYFIIELLIGVFGLISLPLLDFLGKYTAGSNYLLSFFYMFLFLSIPTFLMGITLPLLTKIFNSLISDFLETVSFLYFINTIGAAAGSLFTSYAVISFFGLDTAVYGAVTLNFILAFLIILTKYMPSHSQERTIFQHRTENHDAILGNVAYLLVFITGFLAIGYEIAWFRVIGILVKASPYAFSSILSVYLLGIALGSFGMNKYMKKQNAIDKKNLFFLIQFLIGIYVIGVFAGYYYLTKYTFFSALTRESFLSELHPFFGYPSTVSIKEFFKSIFRMTDVFFWPMFFVLIPTIFMGASFPLISSLALKQRDKEGKTVGTVYFFNITGNVFGGIITGFLLLPYLGTEMTLLGFSLIGLLFGFFINRIGGKNLQHTAKTTVTIVVILMSILFFPGKGKLYEVMHIPPLKVFERYFEEGQEGTVMVYQKGEEIWNYINGLPHGNRPAPGYYNRVVEAVSYSQKLENVLVIGYGAGSITEAVLRLSDVRNVVIVELNSAVIKNLKKLPLFKEMLSDSRLELVIDDGRRYLLRTDKQFDLILIDPLRTTTAYSNNLYSSEFFSLIKSRLSPGGIFKIWMDEHKVMRKTLLSAFEYLRAYDSFCLASNQPFEKNIELQERHLNNFSLKEREGILKWRAKETQLVQDRDAVEKATIHYPTNRDWKPITEYYIGLSMKEKFLFPSSRE